jgi:hypothetical protein
MVVEGLEIFVGGRQDPTFGPIVLLGPGGIYVEVLRDVALRVAPVSPAEARKMIDEIRGGRLLKGVRGEAPADREAVVALIMRLSQLLWDFPEIGEIGVNPVKILPAGRGCVAVDCRIVVATASRAQRGLVDLAENEIVSVTEDLEGIALPEAEFLQEQSAGERDASTLPNTPPISRVQWSRGRLIGRLRKIHMGNFTQLPKTPHVEILDLTLHFDPENSLDLL